MINKKNIWYLTLFSLILALSVYYVTMPSEALLDVYQNIEKNELEKEDQNVVVSETDLIAVHHLEEETAVSKELDLLKMKLVDINSTIEEKNEVYDKIRDIEKEKTLELEIEKTIKQDLGYKSFVKIADKEIDVLVSAKNYDITLASKIMNLVQKKFANSKYVTVKFE